MKISEFFEEFDRRLEADYIERYDENIEMALYSLLWLKKDKLPKFDQNFHKNIRICIDGDEAPIFSAIWNLLHKSKLFWDVANDLDLIKLETK